MTERQTAHRKFYSMASPVPRRCITRSPMACDSAPTAGFMAGAVPRVRVKWDGRARRPSNASRCAALFGVIIRCEKWWSPSVQAPPIRGGTIGMSMANSSCINTVNGHLWHDFPGAHFVRPHTFDPNPHAYALIDQHADHWHFNTTEGWAKSRDGKADDLGGGHAHVGMMIYLGDNWPAEYRGNLFTMNLHGRRANREILERTGSGYVGH